jgi:hypothetical protein
MNKDLLVLYEADRNERVHQPKVNTPQYKAMRVRDSERREQILQMVANGDLHTANDYYHTVQIMNHGDTPEDAENAHRLALRAELGYRPARWLAAASYDRWQMVQGKPQKYGTNFIYDGVKDRLWDVDAATTDEERPSGMCPHWQINCGRQRKQTVTKSRCLKMNERNLRRMLQVG